MWSLLPHWGLGLLTTCRQVCTTLHVSQPANVFQGGHFQQLPHTHVLMIPCTSVAVLLLLLQDHWLVPYPEAECPADAACAATC